MRREKQILSLICSQYANKSIDTMSKPIEHNLKIDPQVHIPTTPEACERRISQLQYLISDKVKQAQLELQEEMEERKSRGDQVGQKAL